MKKVSILFLVLSGILVAAVSCAQPQQAEEPPPQGGIRIEVSRNGFDQTPGEFRLEVEQGQEVEITFVYGDKDFSQNNPHIIAIPDLGIETGVLDQENTEKTLRFTASNTGEVRFMCTDITCAGHPNLQGGIIVIQ